MRVACSTWSDAEVQHLGELLASDALQDHVARLQVAVDDAVLVGLGERARHLVEDTEGGGRIEGTPGQAGGERLALEELHDHVEPAVLRLAALEDPHRVGVTQPGEQLRLAAEPADDLVVLGGVLVQELDRHLLDRVGAPAAIHHGHPPGADPLDHAVPPGEERPDRAVVRRSRESSLCERHSVVRALVEVVREAVETVGAEGHARRVSSRATDRQGTRIRVVRHGPDGGAGPGREGGATGSRRRSRWAGAGSRSPGGRRRGRRPRGSRGSGRPHSR